MQVLTLFSLVVAVGIIIPTVNSEALWWAMVTITSVGYGDYVPVTFWGRVLAMVLMIFGIGIFAVLTGFVAAKVVKLQKGPEDIIAIVQEENAAIRAELAALKELLNQRN
jgi:voltage-gated potassium channel